MMVVEDEKGEGLPRAPILLLYSPYSIVFSVFSALRWMMLRYCDVDLPNSENCHVYIANKRSPSTGTAENVTREAGDQENMG